MWNGVFGLLDSCLPALSGWQRESKGVQMGEVGRADQAARPRFGGAGEGHGNGEAGGEEGVGEC